MNLVEMTGLSYGKVYRIFNGGIDKPTPNSLKLLAKALQLDYSYLFQKAGYVSSTTPTNTSTQTLLPILNWEFCYLAFPFQESLTAGLSDEHYNYHRNLPNGFALTIDEKHTLFPYFSKNDTLICEPNTTPQDNETIIYINTNSKKFKFGIYKTNTSTPYISSLHQNEFEFIPINDSIQSPIVARILLHHKS